MSVTRIRVKERDAIIQSLKSGVTPRIGIQHIQVGRVNEITALHQDIERIADGGASFRLIIGEYGSGKTFFFKCCTVYCVREEAGHGQCRPFLPTDVSTHREVRLVISTQSL